MIPVPISQLKKLRLRQGDLSRLAELVRGGSDIHSTRIPQSLGLETISDPKVTGLEYQPNAVSKSRLSLGWGASPCLHA